MAIERVGVVGAGTMGNGIAQTFAAAGVAVVLLDVEEAFLKKGIAAIEKSLAKFVEKTKYTADQGAAIRGRITPTLDMTRLRDTELVVEAIIESSDAKRKLFAHLDQITPPETILASNTSSISITEIAAATKRPPQVIGMHFMNPVPLMQLVEVIRGLATSDETYKTVADTATRLGKTPVEVNDYPGFVSNRVLMPMINEAAYCLMEGVAGREAIDTVMKLGMNHPMGPLALADFIGLDVCLDILEVLHEGLGDDKYRPSPMLRKYVDSGRLGRKSGRGFYDYSAA